MVNEDFELESRKVEFSEKEEILELMDTLAEEDFIESFENGSLKNSLNPETVELFDVEDKSILL